MVTTLKMLLGLAGAVVFAAGGPIQAQEYHQQPSESIPRFDREAMLIDAAGAVEVRRITADSPDVKPESLGVEETEVVSASDRLPANPIFRVASTRLPRRVAASPAASETDPDSDSGPSPDSFILGSRAFSIPFSVDQSAAGPIQVHLFAAAANAPQTQWKWVEAKEANSSGNQQFDFTADSDGEFWFATWTVQGVKKTSDQEPQPNNIQPQRKIFVDTTKPTIQLSADSDGDGQVSVIATVTDVTPIDEMVLRYITDQMTDWKHLDAGLLRQGQQVQFQPAGDWQQLSVQLVASDKAGNRNSADQLVRRPRVAEALPGPRYADRNLAPWNQLGRNQLGPSISPGNLGRYATHGTGRQPEIILPPPATPDQITNTFLNPPQRPEQTRSLAKPSLAAETPGPETVPAPVPKTDPKQDLQKYRSRSVSEAIRPLSEQSLVPDTQPEPPAPPARALSRRPSVPALSRVPIRFSDSERFSLDYVLEAVDTRGVEAVELYGSVDEGATWKLWGRDPDRQSPFDIETREEGVFGYRIVVVGRSGLASARPIDGDLPDMVVVVDKQNPEVRISGARYGEGDRVGALVIRYEVSDVNLKERPITLAFSENPDGPWTTIAGGLRNDGDHVWPADPGLPRGFYLRLDATDKAGNVGTYILDKPIDAQGLAPRARIRGFQTREGR